MIYDRPSIIHLGVPDKMVWEVSAEWIGAEIGMAVRVDSSVSIKKVQIGGIATSDDPPARDAIREDRNSKEWGSSNEREATEADGE